MMFEPYTRRHSKASKSCIAVVELRGPQSSSGSANGESCSRTWSRNNSMYRFLQAWAGERNANALHDRAIEVNRSRGKKCASFRPVRFRSAWTIILRF